MNEVGRKVSVLVIDDEDLVRSALHVILEMHGFQVAVAGSGEEAVEVYRCECQRIDLVLSDVRMPGLDGPQTFKVLRQIQPSIRCCFMSGDLGKYTEEELLRLGAMRVLSKPLNLLEVIPLLRQLATEPASELPKGIDGPAEGESRIGDSELRMEDPPPGLLQSVIPKPQFAPGEPGSGFFPLNGTGLGLRIQPSLS